jgi:sulfur-oxidizing protein SoxA
MRRIFKQIILCAVGITVLGSASAGPAEDLDRYQKYFKERFPDLSMVDLSNGLYNFNEDKHSQYKDIMEFPPYEVAIEEGKELFDKPFANGKKLADCLPNGGKEIAQLYPKFDKKTGKVKTLPGIINECREQNGEKPMNVLKGDLVKILAYISDTSRGKPISIEIPDDPRALAAYEEGKQVYFTRRGKFDFACYHCHWEASGQRVRGNELSPAIGQAANFPVYRSKWGEIGSIQRRYKGCMKNIGAEPIKEQTEAMNNLEYFHTYLSNGVPLNAPNSRF